MKTTLSIITAALISGAAYAGGPFVGPGMEPSNRLWEQQQFEAQREQLEEIQAQQRQLHYELEQRRQCAPGYQDRFFWMQPADCE